MKRHASMNRIYRLVWNQLTHMWVVVAENARGRGKSSGRKLVAAALALTGGLFLTPLAMAGPVGGQISAGAGAISQAGANTTITQTSQNMAINWQSFGIAANESVRFNQPSATSIALNRILGQSPSQIFGSLSANGQVFLLNPNGVLFAPGSQVNVGGLVASTLGLSDADFMAGKFSFSKGGVAGSVVNQGTLTAAQGGYIALLAPEVRNEGVISATMGTALLAAGDKVSINLSNGSLLSYNIDQGAISALADNKQLIQADGGQVFMSAKAADALSMAVVNNTGIVEARTVQNVAGTIRLMGDMSVGTVNVAGILDASALNGGNGGFIETSAAHVKIANDAKVTTAATSGLTGSWLIDPVDFTIAATGGDMTGTALSTALGGGNVTILSSSGAAGTAGNVNVNDVVSWNANKLTLNAQNNININASMYGSGTASLALKYGQGAIKSGNPSNYYLNNGAQVNLPTGLNFSTQLGSNGVPTVYSVITDLGLAADAVTAPTVPTLQGMATTTNLTGNFVLGANIDATQTSAWNAGAGFTPVGASTASSFAGIFDGLGHGITKLTIKLPTTNFVGLFGSTATGSQIQNVNLLGGSVVGAYFVGSLVGSSKAAVSNSYTTGSVTGGGNVGGLIGESWGSVSNSYATGDVSGTTYTGGLIGTVIDSPVRNSYATGNISGATNIGGLIGYIAGGTVFNSIISNSYATGAVTGGDIVGGLIGGSSAGSVSNSYATGNIAGITYVGGLIGNSGSYVSNSYAAGNISGTTYVGGLIGNSGSYVSNSYWNSTTSGQAASSGTAAGLTTAQMKTQASFTSWDFANTWVMYQGQTSPLLRSFMTPLTVMANSAITTYNAIAYTGGNGVTYSSTPNSNLLGTVTYSGTSQGAINAGSYSIIPGGLYSNQQGYIINYVTAALGITPVGAQVLMAVNTIANNKVYDGTMTATLTGGSLVGVLNGDVVTLNQSGLFASKNVGTNIAVTATDTLSGPSANNYFLIQPIGLTANITPKVITASATNASMVYNGTVYGNVKLSIAGLISGDAVSYSDTAIFPKKNVGTYNSINVVGITVTGTDAGNYTLNNTQLTTSGSITPKSITVSAAAFNKVYDGTVKDLAQLTSLGVIAGDVVKFTNTSVAFSDKNAGNGKTVTVSGIKIGSRDGGNYTINTTATTTANITPKNITVTARGSNKVYDGTVNDTVMLAVTRVIRGDVISFTNTSATFADKNAGAAKVVTVSGIAASGADAGNYTYNTVATTTGKITQKTITVAATGTNKVFDGTVNDVVSLASQGILSGDIVNFADTSATFANNKVGAGKVVTVKGITASGVDALNYRLGNTTATTTASITP